MILAANIQAFARVGAPAVAFAAEGIDVAQGVIPTQLEAADDVLPQVGTGRSR